MDDHDVEQHERLETAAPPVSRADLEERGVRILPSHLARAALDASGNTAGSRCPPRLFRPERLEHLVDLVPRVRAGERVVLQVDQLSEHDRIRALDVATGIAAALDATMTNLETTPGVYLAPRGRAEAVAPSLEDGDATQPADRSLTAPVCALCELRPASSQFDPPIDLVLTRDGSRSPAPRVAICARCRHTVRNWRFAVGWCCECERWGRRGVESPCKRVYGA